MNAKMFVEELSRYKGEDVFNPYSQICSAYDRKDAPSIRRKNLVAILEVFSRVCSDSVWIGRDLGHRGGRRTGIALTDEPHLIVAGAKWGVDLDKATVGDVVSERTAATIWSHLNRIPERVFMWNVFPFHPHERENPLSNRSHNASERDFGMQVLEGLLNKLQPRRVVAIGNDAFNCAIRLRPLRDVIKVRHPSYGGEKDFSRQLVQLYGLDNQFSEIEQQTLPI